MEHAAKLKRDTSGALSHIRSRWLARAIHDFRGPIFAARGYAKLLLDNKNGNVTATQSEYLTHVIENLNKLTGLVNSLEDFPSDDVLRLDEVNFSELLCSAANEWHTRELTLQIRLVLPSHPIFTVGDGEKLTHAMHNLLGGAVEFSRTGGEVHLHARQEEDEVTVRIEAERDQPPAGQQPVSDADIAMAFGILRLHGGTAQADVRRDGRYQIGIRLPLVSFGAQPSAT